MVDSTKGIQTLCSSPVACFASNGIFTDWLILPLALNSKLRSSRVLQAELESDVEIVLNTSDDAWRHHLETGSKAEQIIKK